MDTAKNICLICGDEEYLKEQQKNKLLTELKCDGSLDYNAFSEDNIDIDEISSLMNTLPFMAAKRTIFINDSGWFVGAVSSEVVEIFSDVPDSAIVIFYERKADKSNALYRLVKSCGRLYEYEAADSRAGKAKTAGRGEVRDWLKQELRKAGRRMDTRTLNELTELTGYDMLNLSTELEKLICYTIDEPEGQVISIEDVHAICSKTIQDRVFEMIGCKQKGDITRALAILEELFAVRTAAMLILHIAVKQYGSALGYRECVAQSLSDAEIMTRLSLKDWQLRRIREQVGNTSAGELIRMLENCADTEYRIKSGDVSDRLGIELLMVG